MQIKTKIKILKPGDRVIATWKDENGTRIAVQRGDQDVYVYCIQLDESKFPRIEDALTWMITQERDKTNSTDPNKKVTILESGDQVVNIWKDENGTRIAVQRGDQDVYVYCIQLDESKFPRIEDDLTWMITQGSGEIEISAPNQEVEMKTF